MQKVSFTIGKRVIRHDSFNLATYDPAEFDLIRRTDRHAEKEKHMGYVVSRLGTFGVIHRRYVTLTGDRMVIIRWGPLGWLTPVNENDIKELASSYESIARKEAEEWIKSITGKNLISDYPPDVASVQDLTITPYHNKDKSS